MCQKQILLSGPRAYYSMGWEQECPLRAQLPISASVVWRYHVVVGGDVGIDRLVTDLEDAPDAAADRQCPAVILIGFPVGSDEWACQLSVSRRCRNQNCNRQRQPNERNAKSAHVHLVALCSMAIHVAGRSLALDLPSQRCR